MYFQDSSDTDTEVATAPPKNPSPPNTEDHQVVVLKRPWGGRKHQLEIRVLLGRIFTLQFQAVGACSLLIAGMDYLSNVPGIYPKQ